jgi:lipopolysaccharide biosynthesis glycosyltransferase
MSNYSNRCAFATIHFGNNPVYLELELYFFKMLRNHTRNDILYLYSVNDTPASFVEAVRPFVTEVVPYDDSQITYDVDFASGYSNFNTLRTCNFMFAYKLEKYDKVCIIESDMVIMKNLDSIFKLKAPAVLTYYIGDKNLSYHDRIDNRPSDVLQKCKESGRLNGGVMIIRPSMRLFEKCRELLLDVVKQNCKYPNETLFEYVNSTYYNLPIQYNLSHYLTKQYQLDKYGLKTDDILVYHFNETKFKHIDIIKNPIDDAGNNWIDIIQRDKKYEIKKFPIMHYKTTVYDRYRKIIEPIMRRITEPKKIVPDSILPVHSNKEIVPYLSPVVVKKPSVSPPKNEIRPISPLPKDKGQPDLSLSKEEIRPISPLPKDKGQPDLSLSKEEIRPASPAILQISKSHTIVKTPTELKQHVKKTKCPKGTRRNKKTGECVSTKALSSTEVVETKVSEIIETKVSETKKRCPNGTRRNKKTGLCEAI